MAEDQEEKTEEPSERRLEELREKGQGAKSADVGSAVAMLAVAGAFLIIGDDLARELMKLTVRSLRLVDAPQPVEAIHASYPALMLAGIPLLVISVLTGAAGVAQSRTFSPKLANFDIERLDPAKQLKQLLAIPQQLLEILKQVLKLGAIGWVGYKLIVESMPMFSVLSATPPAAGAAFVAGVAGKLYLRVGIAFAVVAAFDYFMAHRKFHKDSMMSRDEVKQERKGEEASPQLRMRIRAKMRELLRARSLPDVSKATVVVTNPTHYAVALRYVPAKDFAPLVLAKAKDEKALGMRKLARQHQVPIVENKPLARALFADGKVGKAIPVDLYRAAAEVIAFVMQLHAPRPAPRLATAAKANPTPVQTDTTEPESGAEV
jgi:flagellar biosynthesis protein FlhB